MLRFFLIAILALATTANGQVVSIPPGKTLVGIGGSWWENIPAPPVYDQILVNDPLTSAAWTLLNFNASQVGVFVTPPPSFAPLQPPTLTSAPQLAVWTAPAGALPGPVPTRITHKYPLSDQTNIGGWQLVPRLSDEFNGVTLDTKKWRTDFTIIADGVPSPWYGRQPGLFNPANVAVGHGNLMLSVKKEPTNPIFTPKLINQGYHDYTTGIVHSIDRALYGYYEARIKIARANVNNAFWTIADDPTLYPGVNTELDFCELTGTGDGGAIPPYYQWYFASAHIWEYPGKSSNSSQDFGKSYWYISDIAFRDNWHTIGFERTPTLLTWFLDGVKIQTVENFCWHQPQWIVFDNEIIQSWMGLPGDSELPATYYVDYLRFWVPSR